MMMMMLMMIVTNKVSALFCSTVVVRPRPTVLRSLVLLLLIQGVFNEAFEPDSDSDECMFGNEVAVDKSYIQRLEV